MDHELQRRARDIFLEACEKDVEDRRELIMRECAGDVQLQNEVDALLSELETGGPLDSVPAGRLPDAGELFAPGTTAAGRFQVLRLLGRGGMGEVYEAYDTTLKERVALKTMRSEWLGQSGARSRFLREIRLARAVSHPGVCRIYDHARHDTGEGSLDLVSMKLLQGVTLGEYLKNQPISNEAAMTLARDVAEALAAAHEAGVLHLDLKPANIIVLEEGERGPRPVITDFGIARSIHEETTSLTGELRPIGTPQYMAPEQLRGEPATTATDIYALGLVLYELFAGRRAFAAASCVEALEEREKRTGALLSDLRKAVGQRPADAVAACLEMNPRDRPTRVSDVLGLLDGSTPARRKQGSLPRRLVVCGIAASLTIGVLAAALRPSILEPVFSWIESPWPAPLPEEIRLVALPFGLRGEGAPSREYADGLVLSVAERIAKLEKGGAGFVVIPPSESLKVGEDDPQRAASMAGANLVLSGNLVREGDRLRAELTMFNAEAGKVVSTARLDLAEAEPITAREKIASSLAGMLGRNLPPAETSDEAASKAYAHYLPARGYLVRENDLESIENAIRELYRATAEDHENGPIYAALAQAHWRKYALVKDQNSAQLAIQAAANAIRFSPEAAEAHSSSGSVHLNTGRYEEAVADYHRALQLDPNNIEALIGLGRAYERNGELDAAEAALQDAIERRPNLWLGHKWLGLFHYNAGRYAQAIEEYEKILALAPNSIHAHLNIGTFHVLAENYSKAREHWERGVAIQPNALTLGNLARLAQLQGDKEGAIRYLEQAVDLTPAQHRLWGSLGGAYHEAGRTSDSAEAYGRAMELVRRELELNPNDAAAIVMLGHYHASTGEADQALELTEKAVALGGRSPEVLIDAAETYVQVGQREKAAGMVREALALGYPRFQVQGSVGLRDLLEHPSVR